MRLRSNCPGEKIADLHSLLRYNRPFHFAAYLDFVILYKLADFYCALPVLSCHLDSAFGRSSPDFIHRIWSHGGPMLEAAKQLRHTALFRECLTFFASFSAAAKSKLTLLLWPEDLELQKIIAAANCHLCKLIMEADRQINRLIFIEIEARNIVYHIHALPWMADRMRFVNGRETMPSAHYYREIRRGFLPFQGTWAASALVALNELLTPGFVMNKESGGG